MNWEDVGDQFKLQYGANENLSKAPVTVKMWSKAVSKIVKGPRQSEPMEKLFIDIMNQLCALKPI